MKKISVNIGNKNTSTDSNIKAKTKITKKNKVKTKTKETKIKVTTSEDNNKQTKKSSGVKWNFKKGVFSGNTSTKASSSTSSSPRNVEQGFTPMFSNLTPGVAYQQMKELHWTRMRICLLVLLVVIFILHIICMAAANWLQFSTHQTHGLWRVCYQSDNSVESMECFRFDAIAGILNERSTFELKNYFKFTKKVNIRCMKSQV